MIDPVDELKTQAEILHKRIATGDAASRARLRRLTELAKADDVAITAAAPSIRRKHCLTVCAREHGFSTWEHAQRVLRGWEDETDFGALLYDRQSSGLLNVWFASYVEAREQLVAMRRDGQARYLLAYRRQFFVAEAQFIEALGMDPSDADWERLDFDWARPRDPLARRRLYGQRLQALRGRA
ncbi:MAG: hypothetical protein BGO98_37235 [Myxococcales bacterium 68-20]|nr:MAG: hypothetical protein BGO98_37235 [Myxococcales bacterium 68-20]